MTDITAKIKVSSKTPNIDGQTNLNFSPDYAANRNKEWAKFTPTFRLAMVVVDSVAEHFTVGDAYTLTFTKDDPATDGLNEFQGLPMGTDDEDKNVLATGHTVIPPMTVTDFNDGGDY
jgi:hypothetical protein